MNQLKKIFLIFLFQKKQNEVCEYKNILVFLIIENRSDIKNNKRKRGQNQRIADTGENKSSDSGTLQVRRKMLANKRRVRSFGSRHTKALELLETREILEVLM